MKVYKELKNNDLEGARYKISMIVGRDTKYKNLNEEYFRIAVKSEENNKYLIECLKKIEKQGE